ncbi:monosaccharide ABC transporter substrate-binding protein, CUT2 family [Magnetococcus marinus MC-1]|uniref:Monosaccharide ABC transporter substrate-binding protein, CUT2 family n=1 Tax=Magnetococcus marinus (strain ATCC BAA-1437 / JCM 17883 / MC-1) TaxID=156889 RepID=A0LAF8_MAGMM|nr:sugar ABC transporter substrate-binding protein [Magnetococcus marinus]ABK44951.1 monosaccharide ABC transporter substrate-binding protein, CUT2 family [Magnetococcus marinus MC-1]
MHAYFRWLFMFCWILMASHAQAEPFKIGLLVWSDQIAGQVAMRAGLEAEAAHLQQQARDKNLPSFTLDIKLAGDGPAGVEKQIQQMQAMVDDRVDLIIVQPTDNAALSSPLQAANQAGIPVVAYDQYISGGHLSAFVTSNNYQAGFLDGEYMAHHFADDHTIQIILVEYPYVSSTIDRVDGFFDALNQYKQPYRILRSYQAVEPVQGRAVGQQILQDFPQPGSVDALFTINDGGGLAIVDELEKAGRHELFVATIDGDPNSVARIRKGSIIKIDSAQFCGPIGAEAMRAAYAILTAGKVHEHWLVPVFPITRQSVAHYPGWSGPIPEHYSNPCLTFLCRI